MFLDCELKSTTLCPPKDGLLEIEIDADNALLQFDRFNQILFEFCDVSLNRPSQIDMVRKPLADASCEEV
jgi:hypothetical protein